VHAALNPALPTHWLLSTTHCCLPLLPCRTLPIARRPVAQPHCGPAADARPSMLWTTCALGPSCCACRTSPHNTLFAIHNPLPPAPAAVPHKLFVFPGDLSRNRTVGLQLTRVLQCLWQHVLLALGCCACRTISSPPNTLVVAHNARPCAPAAVPHPACCQVTCHATALWACS
jgi:hypothetical protein